MSVHPGRKLADVASRETRDVPNRWEAVQGLDARHTLRMNSTVSSGALIIIVVIITVSLVLVGIITEFCRLPVLSHMGYV